MKYANTSSFCIQRIERYDMINKNSHNTKYYNKDIINHMKRKYLNTIHVTYISTSMLKKWLTTQDDEVVFPLIK